jgi:16S rRNA processing protein RimM
LANSDETFIALGEIVRPHGVQGELRVKLYNADSEVLFDLDKVRIELPSGGVDELTLDAVRPAGDALLIRAHSVADRNAAEALRGAVLSVPRSALPALDEDEFYVCDVIGASAQLEDGSSFGLITDYRTYPSVEVFVILGDGKQYEIPNLEDFVVHVDLPSKRVVFRSIEDFETR